MEVSGMSERKPTWAPESADLDEPGGSWTSCVSTAWAPTTVLVTGGSGFFGRAFVDECLKRGSSRVCVYSRDEAKHATMRAESGDERVRYFVGDVRDVGRLERAMQGVSHVVHAAALKRVETGEYDTDELVKTNVLGTMNVIEAARRAGVTRAVLVSTDKAVEPANAYGASKLLAERLWAGAQAARGKDGPWFTTVRYGNVAGSTGSVIPTWRQASESSGRRMYITDPAATRFWMTRAHAVELVLRACHSPEALLVPELPAYALGDLAKAMGLRWAEDAGIGLQPGEKLHESLLPGVTSDQARRMTVDELRKELANV